MLNGIISFLYDKDYRNLLISSVLILCGGATFYHFVEGWSWVDSIYFSFISLTTVGFGDITPETSLGKIFTIFYLTIGIGLILTFLDILFKHYSVSARNMQKAQPADLGSTGGKNS